MALLLESEIILGVKIAKKTTFLPKSSHVGLGGRLS